MLRSDSKSLQPSDLTFRDDIADRLYKGLTNVKLGSDLRIWFVLDGSTYIDSNNAGNLGREFIRL
jgi:hypothetical protein